MRVDTYGCPENYTGHFPAYMLKVIQTWFKYNGDSLYEKLKHIRNYLCDFEAPQTNTDHCVEVLACAHDLLHRKKLKSRSSKQDNKQMQLF